MAINLLPEKEIIKSLDKKEIIKKFVCGVLCSLAVIVLVNIYLKVSLETKKVSLKKLQSKYKEYLSLREAKNKLEKEITELKRKKVIIKRASPQHRNWTSNLIRLTELMPEEMWLNKLAANTNLNTNTIQIEGFLFTLDIYKRPISILNDFIKSLNNTDVFYNINVRNIRTVSLKGKEALKFNLSLLTH